MSVLITIEHSLEELSTILTALAEKPFKEVANLIAKIHMTANAQQAAAAPTEPAAPAAPAPTEPAEPAAPAPTEPAAS